METSIALARAGVSSVLEPGDSGYADAVGGFDLSVPFAPDVVIDAHSPSEVASAIAVVADRGETLSVMGAGHGRLHEAKGGVAITLRHLDSVDVDPGGRTARVGAGLTWDPVLAATAPHGLAAVCGSAPGVGVVGYLLGGGIGPLQSSLGFSSDHVRSFDIVTPADGPITVSKDDHSDLFWALRGGKGGFGVVTSVTIDLLEVTHVYGGGVYFAARSSRCPRRLRRLGTLAPRIVDHVDRPAPSAPVDALPEAIRGRHVAHVRFASLDSGDAHERSSTTSAGWPGPCSTPLLTSPTASWVRSTATLETRCPSSMALHRWPRSTATPSTPCSVPLTSKAIVPLRASRSGPWGRRRDGASGGRCGRRPLHRSPTQRLRRTRPHADRCRPDRCRSRRPGGGGAMAGAGESRQLPRAGQRRGCRHAFVDWRAT